MTKEEREANRIILSISHRSMAARAAFVEAEVRHKRSLRRGDKEGGGVLQTVDQPKAGSGGAAAKMLEEA